VLLLPRQSAAEPANHIGVETAFWLSRAEAPARHLAMAVTVVAVDSVCPPLSQASPAEHDFSFFLLPAAAAAAELALRGKALIPISTFFYLVPAPPGSGGQDGLCHDAVEVPTSPVRCGFGGVKNANKE
jgi:hypothetical protein